MKILIDENKGKKYDTGHHPYVTKILFKRREIGDFFEGDRFPDLTNIYFDNNARKLKLKLNCPSLVVLHYCSYLLEKLELECPSLEALYCPNNQLTKLKLNCPSLVELSCCRNNMTKLELDCPSLRNLECRFNYLTELNLNCPSLRYLICNNNDELANLNGLEFCEKLTNLRCPPHLAESVKILRNFLPNIKVEYEYEKEYHFHYYYSSDDFVRSFR
jgi:hypothetical protein